MSRILDLKHHPSRHVTVEELADYWNVSKKTIYRLIDKGAIPVTKVGTLIRIRTDDAREFGKPNTPDRMAAIKE